MKKTLLAVMAMVSLCGYAQIPIEGFESPWVSPGPDLPAAPPGWRVVNEQGPIITWQQSGENSTESPPFGGNHAAFLGKENVSPTAPSPRDWLISPLIQVIPNAQLQFRSRLTLPADQGGIYKIFVGTDASDLSTFTEIYSATELELNPIQTEYMLKYITIPEAYTNAQVHIAFVMEGDDADRWLIDDVGIFAACNPPSELVAVNITDNSAEISWTENGNATQWEIEILPDTAAPTGIGVVVTSNPYVVTDLLPGVYKIYIRSTCNDGGMSVWVGPYYLYADQAFNNTVHGIVRYDANDDETCDDTDTPIAGAAVSVTIDGEYAYTAYTGLNGEYILYGLEDGTHTLTLVPSVPGFPAFPALTETVEFDEEVDDWSVSHCLPYPDPFNNMGINLYTYGDPRPGFDIIYYLQVKNWGVIDNEAVTVALQFDAARLDFVPTGSSFNGVVSGNTITLTVGDIAAAQQVLGNIKFHVKEPPVNMGQEIINFSAALSAVANDIDMTNNTVVYEDIIVNSYDPNDITVHEGAEINEDQTENYLTYTIRFQNTGSAEAINIKLENTLDELLDWDTFEPIASSHSYIVKRTESLLEFEYDNIFLPDSTANEPGSHGHITYRIKPKASFGLNDMISNKAEIYFDFNPAIDTNIATTKVVQETAGLNNNALAIARLYPSPVKDQLHVEVAQGELQSVAVYDINGRLCLSANAGIIDTNSLTSGIYFVKVTTDAGSANYKIIKH